MSKDRPFKTFRSPSERPFKAYSPDGTSVPVTNNSNISNSVYNFANRSSSALFQDSEQSPPSPDRLANGLMAQQSSQHGLSLGQHGLQVYGDPEDFTRLAPGAGSQAGGSGGPNPLLNIDPSLNHYYDDLDLDDQENPLMRQDLLVSNDPLLQQHHQRNSDPSVAPPSSSGAPTPSFIVPTRAIMRGGLPPVRSSTPNMSSLPESLSMLFDQPPLPLYTNSGQHQGQLPPTQQADSMAMLGRGMSANIGSSSYMMPSTTSSMISPSNGRSAGTNGNNGSGRLNSGHGGGMNRSVNNFLVKQEADEGNSSFCGSASPLHSPSPSDESTSESQPESFRRAPKRPHSEMSGSNEENPSTSGLNGNSVPSSSSGGSATSPGGNGTTTNNGDSNNSSSRVKPESKDPAYLEKRRKNNESAKRSREARRNKEELVALRVVTLEEENMRLRAESSLLERELDELRHRLFQ